MEVNYMGFYYQRLEQEERLAKESTQPRNDNVISLDGFRKSASQDDLIEAAGLVADQLMDTVDVLLDALEHANAVRLRKRK
jgi:hypothetical protein